MAAAFVVAAQGALAGSPYDEGRNDRLRWEQWLGTLTCVAREGADYWLAHKDNSPPGSRASPCERGDQSKAMVVVICRHAQALLGPMDARQATDPAYKAGWNAPLALVRQAHCPAYSAPEPSTAADWNKAPNPPPYPAPEPTATVAAAPPEPTAPAPLRSDPPADAQMWQTLLKLMIGQQPAEPGREAGISMIWLVGGLMLAVLGVVGRLIPAKLWEAAEQLQSQARTGNVTKLARLSTSLLWGCAVLVAAGLVYAVAEAQFDLLRLNWTVIVLIALAVGIWRALRDGRGPIWRLAILLLWTAILAAWLGLGIAIGSAAELAIEGGFGRQDQWTLASLVAVALLAVRGSAWIYAMLITEWQLNPVTGERHRVLSRSHGEVLLDHRTWIQRRNEEMIERRERRKWLVPQLVILAGCAFAMLYGWANFSALSLLLSGGLLFGAYAIASILSGLVFKPLLPELLYQSGYQGMKGAKVFDRKPTPKASPFGAPPASAMGDEEEHGGRRTA